MRIRQGGSSAWLVAVAAVVVIAIAGARPASADPVTGGDLYGVFPTSGVFNAGSYASDNYIVMHLVAFGPSDYPDGLAPIGFPAGHSLQAAGVMPDSQYFLIGALHAVPDTLATDHLLLSAGSSQVAPEILISSLHDPLIAGTFGLTGMPPIYQTSAGQFWGGYTSLENEQSFVENFFGQKSSEAGGPLGTLTGTMFQGGSEEVYGFTFPQFIGTLNTPNGGLSFTNGNGLTYVAPEPALPLLLLCGAGIVVALRRRRRQAA